MQLSETQNKLLAILFAAGEPLEGARLGEAIGITAEEVSLQTAGISAWLTDGALPLELRQLGSAYQLCTSPVYAGEIRRALELRRNTPLTPAALEVLAIIAYNQPVTRGFVEQVRGWTAPRWWFPWWKRGWWRRPGGWTCRAGPSPTAPPRPFCGALAWAAWRSSPMSPEGRRLPRRRRTRCPCPG